MRTKLVPALLVAFAAAVQVSPAVVDAADTAPPRLTGFSINPASVSATGLSTAPVTFTAHLTDPSGIRTGECDFGTPLPKVVIVPVGDTRQLFIRDVYLHLSTGTDTDGTWSGTLSMTAGVAGTWRALYVVMADKVCNSGAVDPATLDVPATVSVSGTHAPHLSLGFRPNPVDSRYPYLALGRAYYPDTGAAIPHLRVCIGYLDVCNVASDPAVPRFTSTDANGYYSIRFDPRTEEFVLGELGASLVRTQAGESDKLGAVVFAMRERGVPWRPTVVAATTTPTVRLGGAAVVVGRVLGVGLFPHIVRVQLQQRGRTGWRTVASGRTRPSSRYTFSVRPHARGRFTYRVAAVAGGSALTARSAAVVVRVR